MWGSLTSQVLLPSQQGHLNQCIYSQHPFFPLHLGSFFHHLSFFSHGTGHCREGLPNILQNRTVQQNYDVNYICNLKCSLSQILKGKKKRVTFHLMIHLTQPPHI
ncbi:unnamed protein product [Rangifer tarandus platyrhynchus]|uniref:Uncharacterized protein n=2 Tax=Rangifer tarandus platyrhynchus TaxID=3082113 RepID=A0AC59ZDJ9_RANTA|nr:unnamed protein product [Rangifer tarandus platyrhynchus]